VRVEQSNTSIMFGHELFFKLFRKLDKGVNPDLEIARQLTRKGFDHTPEVTGELNYRADGVASTLGVLKRYVPNEGDAWSYTLDALSGYFERVLIQQPETRVLALDVEALLERSKSQPPVEAHELMGPYLESARLLGIRTAEMHRALAAGVDRKEFAPEPFSALYQRSLYQSMRNLSGRIFHALDRRLDTLPDDARALAASVLERRAVVLERMGAVVGEKMETQRIRTHGDYHLGQVLYTGRDFVVIDFEGEPARPLTERRLKRSAVSDVAGMLRSFSYAAYTAVADEEVRGMARADALEGLDRWARYWVAWASAAFLQAYRSEAGTGTGLLPARDDQLRILLDAHLLEKAVYELGYELNNRPDWIVVPLRGLNQLLDGRA
jgi:maltose alpha-D-glucosyltransferase / alpha-amylase